MTAGMTALAVLVIAVCGAAWVLYPRLRHAQPRPPGVNTTEISAERLDRMLREAEAAQYVPLAAVDRGDIREIAARAFFVPPSGDVVVLVGSYSECNHTIDVLHLNPLRVVVAEYPWRLHELPAGLRVIVLPSAIELPAIEGIMECLRSMGDARYVRLLV